MNRIGSSCQLNPSIECNKRAIQYNSNPSTFQHKNFPTHITKTKPLKDYCEPLRSLNVHVCASFDSIYTYIYKLCMEFPLKRPGRYDRVFHPEKK